VIFLIHMSDSSRRTPPLGLKKPTRMQSQDDRDTEGLAARREREAAAVKEFAAEEITGRLEGEELVERRSARPALERIGRLERKHDELKLDVEKKHDELNRNVAEVRSDVKTVSGQVSNLRADVAGAVGKLDGQEKLLSVQERLISETLSIVKKTSEREHVTFTAKVEVDKEKELADIEIAKEKKLASIEVTKEEKVDTVKAKRDRRKRNLKILGFVGGGASVVELLHRLWEWL
jgi:hypothetical protein